LRPNGLIVAIDGPSGAGKSTAGRALARRLGYVFIDTGAMYRALAWRALRDGVALDDGDALSALARSTDIGFETEGTRVYVGGEDVTLEIRTREVSAAASRISVHSGVRREMVRRQRELGRDGGVVLDGRDIGSAVFPDAELKLYVDADPRRRAQRRHRELASGGEQGPGLEAIEAEIRSRDLADTTRVDSPLVRAADAVFLDSSDLLPDEVVARMESLVRERLAGVR
jgi:cytidylate kinase